MSRLLLNKTDKKMRVNARIWSICYPHIFQQIKITIAIIIPRTMFFKTSLKVFDIPPS